MTQIDPREYRRTIGLFATGVTVITAQSAEEIHGMTANSVTSVSLDPLLLLVCVDRRARMAATIAAAGRFAVNILSEHQEAISRHFAGRPSDTPVPFAQLDGVPTLHGTLATIVCTVRQVLDGGDHLIVLGGVDAISQAPYPSAPLLYFAGHYRRIDAAAQSAATDPYSDFFYHNLIPFE